MEDPLETRRKEMIEKATLYEAQKQLELSQKQSACEHTFTTRSRVSRDGKEQIIGCEKCNYRKLIDRT